MPNWNDLLKEVTSLGSTCDVVRRRYLHKLGELTGRNVISYYSGWLQKPDAGSDVVSITDEDKDGFMTTINRMDRSKGLDLVLHTPGGDIAATESLVEYLRSMFGSDIRALVPQMAMSCGTMICCSCKEILMGKESSLGPTDPFVGGLSASGVLEEFERAKTEVKNDASTIPVWQAIIAKYSPTLIGESEKALAWSRQLVDKWLQEAMFEGDPEAIQKAEAVAAALANHPVTLSHSRHLSAEACMAMGLKIRMLESDKELQDVVLSLHHANMLTLSQTPALKIIENQEGVAYIKMAAPMIVTAK